MSSFSIKYQTAETVPPPFAHAIEINGKIEQNKDLSLSFELTYLDRETLTEEEIVDEGFTGNDNFQWQGEISKAWGDILYGNLKASKPLKINNLEEYQEFWQIDFEDKSFYPDNFTNLKYLVEEIQQAVYEKAEIELPLNLTFLKKNPKEDYEVNVSASFVERKLEIKKKNHLTKAEYNKILKWEELNFILKNAFAGDFYQELASGAEPSKYGIYVNLGDEIWYELGKSWDIPQNKIQAVLNMAK